MIWIMANAHCFPFAIGIDQCDWECIIFQVDASVVAEGKWPVDSGVGDGPPEIDNLEAASEECRSIFGGEMAMDASGGCL